MTWVKVCGLSHHREVVAAVAAGADAVGFVAYAGSPRYIPLEKIAALAAGVPILSVLLTVDLPAVAVMDAVDATGVTAVQPYGTGSAEVAAAALARGLTVLRPVRASTGMVLPTDGSIPLVDSPHHTLHGGTGTPFDWELATALEGRFVLAGGLGPGNVADAIARVRPWGVDASSGLEQAPGVKDLGKVVAFIEKARAS